MWVIAAIGIGVVAVAVALGVRRARRRARRRVWMATPLPEGWQGILERNLAIYRRLPDERKQRLHGLVQVFVHEKRFEGAGGLEIDDEIRVTIAGQACLLRMGQTGDEVFPQLVSIVVYPSAFRAVGRRRVGGRHVEEEQVRLGESWGSGTVVLAWDSSRRGGRDGRDGHNVVLHEFAHQLDQLDGVSDGTPPLADAAQLRTWVRVLGEGFADLQRLLDDGERALIDDYGATSPAEYFAVATEVFFEKPRRLRERRPELYEVFTRYFGVDPASWPKPASPRRDRDERRRGRGTRRRRRR